MNIDTKNSQKYEGLFGGPPFPDWVIQQLPDIISYPAKILENGFQQSLFALSLITSISAIIPSKFLYSGKPTFSNLFSIGCAPPGSNKGVASFSHTLIKPVQKLIRQIPLSGNTTIAGIFENVHKNKGGGLVFETELDDLNGAIASAGKPLSSILMKSWQNEPISKLIKKNIYMIETPHFSVMLTCTPQQLKYFISSSENGLLSRFCFLFFKGSNKMENVFDNNDGDLINRIVSSSEELFKLAQKYMEISPLIRCIVNHPITYMQKYQEEKFLKVGQSRANFLVENFSSYDIAVVWRNMLMTHKIASNLTVLRVSEHGKAEKELEISDLDFEIALSITETLFKHSVKYLHYLNTIFDSPEQTNQKRTYSHTERNFKSILERLPEEFGREEFEMACEGVVTPRTGYRYIEKHSQVKRIGQGKYIKLIGKG